MKPAPYLFFWFSGLPSHQWRWPSTTKYSSPAALRYTRSLLSPRSGGRASRPAPRGRATARPADTPASGELAWFGPRRRMLATDRCKDASSCGGAVTEGGRAGMRGAALRAAVLASGAGVEGLSSARSSAPSRCSRRSPPPPGRSRRRRSRSGWASASARATGCCTPSSTRATSSASATAASGWAARSRRSPRLPGQPRRGADPPARPQARWRTRPRRTPTWRSSADGEIAVAEVIEGSSGLHVGGARGRVQPRGPRVPPSARCSWPRAPDETIDDYLGQRQLRPSPRTRWCERRDIKSDLNAVRETGVGHDLEELASRLLLRRRAGAGCPRGGGGLGRSLGPDRSLAPGGGAPHAALRLRRRPGIEVPRAPGTGLILRRRAFEHGRAG